jgi:hypothetical protein
MAAIVLKLVNRLIGVLLMAGYGWLFLHLDRYLPGLVVAQGALSPRVFLGVAVVLILPVVGIACVLTPGTFRNRFSPRYGRQDSALLTDGFWVLLGYLMLLLSGAILILFA